MQRKVMMVALATLAAGFAGFVVAGSALGAGWIDYEGKLTAGSGYAIVVPPGAEAFEVLLAPKGDGALAHVTILDPTDARIGYYTLDGSTTAADVVNPDAGVYVVYVYDVKNATLGVRLRAADAPQDLKLVRATTMRTDVPVATFDEAAPLSKILTVNVKAEPVFMTLLYQGQVESLNADVATKAGPVVTIRDESGTAYAPGLTTGSSGTRTLSPENLAAGRVDVTVRAASFEGQLFLTTLTLSRPVIAPQEVSVPPVPPVPTVPKVVVEPGQAMAIRADGGVTMLLAPAELEEKHDNHTRGGKHGYYGPRSSTSYVVYGPDDAFVASGEVGGRGKNVSLPLEMAGEYVVYVHRGGAPVSLSLLGVDAIESHELPVVKRAFNAGHVVEPLGAQRVWKFSLESPPLEMAARLDGADAVAVGARTALKSERGPAVMQENILQASSIQLWDDAKVVPKHMVAGPWSLALEGATVMGDLRVDWLTYEREVPTMAVAIDVVTTP